MSSAKLVATLSMGRLVKPSSCLKHDHGLPLHLLLYTKYRVLNHRLTMFTYPFLNVNGTTVEVQEWVSKHGQTVTQ